MMRRILVGVWIASIIAAIMLIFVNLGALYPDVLVGWAIALLVTALISAIGFTVAWVEQRAYTEGYKDAAERAQREKEALLP